MKGVALGARELVEIDADILAGERTAEAIAESFEVCTRTIVRRRAQLRKQGFKLRVPEPDFSPEFREALSRRRKATSTTRGLR